MRDSDLMALAFLFWGVTYAALALFRWDGGFTLHRRMTAVCLGCFSAAIWQAGDSDFFWMFAFGFVVGWFYQGVRLTLKAEHIFGKEVSHALLQEMR